MTASIGPALAADDVAAIRAQAAPSDLAGLLTPELRALIEARGWLRMLAPRDCGGAELSLPEVVRLEEALAAADGSVGWTVTLCAGAGWFAGFLAPEVARALLATPAVCFGGSGAPSGFADVEDDGYRLSGRWEIATGAPMATHFTMNAVLRAHGVALRDPAGAPLVRAFIVPAAGVVLHKSWRSIGLRATASHAFSVDAVRVGAQYGFDIDPARATAPGPLYQFPFASLADVTLAANLAGMARRFLELARASLERRRQGAAGRLLIEVPSIGAALALAEDALDAARAHCYGVLDRMWSQVCRRAPVDPADMAALRAASLALVGAARAGVDAVYPFCGLHAASEASEMNRVWRDLHTASQHASLLPGE